MEVKSCSESNFVNKISYQNFRDILFQSQRICKGRLSALKVEFLHMFYEYFHGNPGPGSDNILLICLRDTGCNGC